MGKTFIIILQFSVSTNSIPPQLSKVNRNSGCCVGGDTNTEMTLNSKKENSKKIKSPII